MSPRTWLVSHKNGLWVSMAYAESNMVDSGPRWFRLVQQARSVLVVLSVLLALTAAGAGSATADHRGPVCPTGDLADHNEGQRAFTASERAGNEGPLNAYAEDRGINVAQAAISDRPPQCEDT